VLIESSTTSVIEKSKSKRSLKEKRRSTIWGAHLGVREGGRRGKGGGGGEGRKRGVCTSSKREA
jgi:hypothetical protein